MCPTNGQPALKVVDNALKYVWGVVTTVSEIRGGSLKRYSWERHFIVIVPLTTPGH